MLCTNLVIKSGDHGNRIEQLTTNKAKLSYGLAIKFPKNYDLLVTKPQFEVEKTSSSL